MSVNALAAAGGPSTSCAVPTLALRHRGLTHAQLRATIGSLADRESQKFFDNERLNARALADLRRADAALAKARGEP